MAASARNGPRVSTPGWRAGERRAHRSPFDGIGTPLTRPSRTDKGSRSASLKIARREGGSERRGGSQSVRRGGHKAGAGRWGPGNRGGLNILGDFRRISTDWARSIALPRRPHGRPQRGARLPEMAGGGVVGRLPVTLTGFHTLYSLTYLCYSTQIQLLSLIYSMDYVLICSVARPVVPYIVPFV